MDRIVRMTRTRQMEGKDWPERKNLLDRKDRQDWKNLEGQEGVTG